MISADFSLVGKVLSASNWFTMVGHSRGGTKYVQFLLLLFLSMQDGIGSKSHDLIPFGASTSLSSFLVVGAKLSSPDDPAGRG